MRELMKHHNTFWIFLNLLFPQTNQRKIWITTKNPKITVLTTHPQTPMY